MNAKLAAAAVQVGQELAPRTLEPITRQDIARYAGASGDFNLIHIDEIFAKEKAKLPGVFAMGMLPAGLLSVYVTDWAGIGAVRGFRARFGTRVWPGDVLICRGRVTEKSGDPADAWAEIDLWMENQHGEKVITGGARVVLAR